jgi:hypothetical protein
VTYTTPTIVSVLDLEARLQPDSATFSWREDVDN